MASQNHRKAAARVLDHFHQAFEADEGVCFIRRKTTICR